MNILLASLGSVAVSICMVMPQDPVPTPSSASTDSDGEAAIPEDGYCCAPAYQVPPSSVATCNSSPTTTPACTAPNQTAGVTGGTCISGQPTEKCVTEPVTFRGLKEYDCVQDTHWVLTLWSWAQTPPGPMYYECLWVETGATSDVLYPTMHCSTDAYKCK